MPKQSKTVSWRTASAAIAIGRLLRRRGNSRRSRPWAAAATQQQTLVSIMDSDEQMCCPYQKASPPNSATSFMNRWTDMFEATCRRNNIQEYNIDDSNSAHPAQAHNSFLEDIDNNRVDEFAAVDNASQDPQNNGAGILILSSEQVMRFMNCGT
eukprot:m.65677 g.65677  ORF g.65677 m.65677 type:complete len:154 (+) comp7582_c0_seq2:2756-3217(+)